MEKKDEWAQERMFGRSAKLTTSNSFNALEEMGFLDYGGRATFLRLRDNSSRFFTDCVFRNLEKPGVELRKRCGIL